jgi:transcriptional regulator with XRE-family HTH domain
MAMAETLLYVETNGNNDITHIPMNERLKMLRLEKGYTMQTMSDFLGVAKSTYAGYEANKIAQNHRYPKMELLIKMAEMLETSTDYLLCLTNDRRPKTLPRDVNKILNTENLEYNGVKIDKETREFIRLVIHRTLNKGD